MCKICLKWRVPPPIYPCNPFPSKSQLYLLFLSTVSYDGDVFDESYKMQQSGMVYTVGHK